MNLRVRPRLICIQNVHCHDFLLLNLYLPFSRKVVGKKHTSAREKTPKVVWYRATASAECEY